MAWSVNSTNWEVRLMLMSELYLEILSEKDGGRGPSYMALPNEKMVLGFSHWLGQGKKFGSSLNN